MTTETPELDEQEKQEPEASTAEPVDAAAAEPPEPEAGSTPFWRRPAVERYLVPFVLPLLVVGTVVMFVLNISRIFLSTHGNVPVIVGSAILLTILIGAAVLSAAPQMRSSSLALVTTAFAVSIMMFGWLALGAAEPEGEGGTTLAAEGPATEALEFESSNSLVFVPADTEAATGIAAITLTNQGGEHTFEFEDGELLFDTLSVTDAGDVSSARAYFGEPGDYIFYCTITGHREAGMEGSITVDGEPVTLEEAEAAAGEAPASPDDAGSGDAPAGSTESAPEPDAATPTSIAE